LGGAGAGCSPLLSAATFRIVEVVIDDAQAFSIARLWDSLEPSERGGDPAGGVALPRERGERFE
jgi:hypothetical protein